MKEDIKNLGYIVSLSLALFATNAFACDPCSLYSASEIQGFQESAFRLSIAEQYTDFKTSKKYKDNSLRDGELVDGFSVTQISASYDFADRSGAQLSLPVIARDYDSFTTYRRDSEQEIGIGDVSLLGYYSIVSDRTGEASTVWNIFGGVKLPTGETGSINRSLGEEHSEDEHNSSIRHHTVAVGNGGGKVLSLGTGSFDYPIGTSIFLQENSFFFLASVQYTFRTEGDYDYRFDNDTIWNFGPGKYLLLNHDRALAARIVASGEHKGRDKLKGSGVEDSEIKNFYLGPELIFTYTNWAGEIGVDIPVYTDDSAGTVVPQVRIRSALSYRF